MKHYETNDRYTDKKKHKGEYKGDEMKIQISLPQPDNMKTLILSSYDSGYSVSIIQIENNETKIVNGDHYDLWEFEKLIDYHEEKTKENFKNSKFFNEFDKIFVIDNAYAYQIK